MTPVFFHIAAVVMQVGVLLLITDTRLGARDTRREVHSYGTTEYSQSVVVHGTWSSMYDGHYETVAVPAGDVLGGPVSVDRPARHWRTRFARDDSLLVTARQHAEYYSSAGTLDHLRVHYAQHTAVLLDRAHSVGLLDATSRSGGSVA